MNNMYFFAHAGAGNHGCEAIVRSSAGILGNNITLFSAHPEEDRKYGLSEVVAEIRKDVDLEVKRFTLPWLHARIQTKLTGSIDAEINARKHELIHSAKPGDIWFSIGGDNYCYPGTDVLAAQNRLLKKRGVKTVLWGCSVEPELLQDPAIAKDLASFDLITARETISYNALKQINPHAVLVSDPAFTLKRVDLPLPDGWVENKMIGINASPLILENANDGNLVLDAYKNLIQTILDTTDCSVALIPHVVWQSNDDRIPLQMLYDAFNHTGRVILLDDYNCMELKGFIARCRMFIGARTHATIAAYSSCVPTLVLGYSVKSRGIARDLFGTEENYVLPVQQLRNADELAEGFMWLTAHESSIRAHLSEIMPAYIEKAFFPAAEILQKSNT